MRMGKINDRYLVNDPSFPIVFDTIDKSDNI